ncbi:MAG TPA: ABC transporter ATP-binding protein [Gammaproteobacteria bacterium]|nr:ABC transporter ATP-binding protein [Gammaproteobacteria bacterium]
MGKALKDIVLIELSGIIKTYREGETRRSIFDALEARFEKGEFVCITGRSGTGKSTLLNLISGIDLPDKGEVHVDGEDITRLSDRDRTLVRRRRIGFVFQFFNLIPTLNVEENLRLPLELNAKKGSEWDRRVAELLRKVGLGDRAWSAPENLSGGEQQRVAIARALVHRPDLLLADEPTGNLDQETGRVVLELLASMTREAGATLLMVTHSSDATAYADRVMRIRDGRLEAAPNRA